MKALYIISLVLAFTISFVATQGLTALPYLGQVKALTNYGSNYFYMDLERARQDPERKNKLFFSISYRKGYYIKTKWLNFYYCYSNVADPYSCTFERKSRYYSRTMSGRNYRYYKVDNEADNYRYILLDFEFPYSIPDAITVGSMRSQTGWYIASIVLWSILGGIVVIVLIIFLIYYFHSKGKCHNCCRNCCEDCCDKSSSRDNYPNYGSVPVGEPAPGSVAVGGPVLPNQNYAAEGDNLVDNSGVGYGAANNNNYPNF